MKPLRTLTRARAAIVGVAATAAILGGTINAGALGGGNPPPPSDELVSVGSPSMPFSQNKQNEPAVAMDPTTGNEFAASNDELDLAACQRLADGSGTCPFNAGVGVSGIYFNLDLNYGTAIESHTGWIQPTYVGWSDRTGTPSLGPIGTVPNYVEAGLVSQGDPGLAVGPRPDSAGRFAWSNGSRIYYSNLVSNFPGANTLATGFFAVAVSHTDDPQAASAGQNSAWSSPSVATGRINPVLFDDKPAIWVDNAATSPHLGRLYVSWTAFRAAASFGRAEPEPIMVAHSDDGSVTWSAPTQATPATNNSRTQGRQGSTIRTDSHGVVYLFFEGATPQLGSAQMMTRSFNGGRTFETPRAIAKVTDVGVFDSFTGRFTFDGFAGARTNSFPSADIANAAPRGLLADGTPADNRLVLTWSDGRSGPGNEEARVITSTDGGSSWSSLPDAQLPGDRPDSPAIAITGGDGLVYVVYDAFHAIYPGLSQPRPMEGVVVALAVGQPGATWQEFHRGASGDARASSANSLVSEFIGDYNAITAVTSGVCAPNALRCFRGASALALWNDVRSADNCDAVNAYRGALRGSSPAADSALGWGEDKAATGAGITSPLPPYPPTACGPASRFGNTDIYGGTYAPLPG